MPLLSDAVLYVSITTVEWDESGDSITDTFCTSEIITSSHAIAGPWSKVRETLFYHPRKVDPVGTLVYSWGSKYTQA
jgi:hypothetical protein